MTVAALRQLPVARVTVFAALAALVAGYWLALLAEPPIGRVAVALLAIVAGGCGFALIERLRLPRLRAAALALAVWLAATWAAMVAVGVPASTLFPGGWSELAAGVDRGLAGLGGDVEFPYTGSEAWSRLVVLAGLTCVLALAAALAFWPGASARRGPRLAALLVLVGAFVAAAAIDSALDSPWAGAALLVGMAAWLWLPGLGRRRAVPALAAIALLAAATVPLASSLETRPWLKYRDWGWGGPAAERSFAWDHSYGPLAEREGTPLFEVRSDARNYWRAAVLDSFNGYTWERSRRDVGQVPLELPTTVDRGGPAGGAEELNPDWIVRTEFSMRSLRSEFALAPGAVTRADGLELDPTPNGSVFSDQGPLTEGDSYTTFSYAPKPSAAQLRAAPDRYAPALARHTTLVVPSGFRAEPEDGLPVSEVVVPLRGTEDARAERVAARLAASRYGRVYGLARRWTNGAGTPYDAARRIERRLRNGYAYDESVALKELPLRGFLFEQGRGYCQQFSGSMALMLRMLGIPTRVATGFSPGAPVGSGRYQVTDYDAHSWVEVYFTGIGWTAFEPTPGAAPAQLQASDAAAGGLAPGTGPEDSSGRQAATPAADPAAGEGGGSGGVPLWPLAIALALPLAAALATLAVRVHRHRSLSEARAAEVRVRELAGALDRLGWGLAPTITLHEIERRLRAARRPGAAEYAARLAALRFGAGEDRLPSLAERRRLRRDLRRLSGWEARFASFRAIPPLAPRRRERSGWRSE